MNLLVDIGNQNLKWACGNRNGLFPAISDHFAQHATQQWSDLTQIRAVFAVNVCGNDILADIQQYALEQTGLPLNEVTATAQCCGVKNGYQKSSELGADRWVAVIAAWSLAAKPAIVVDCGTAITVDALSKEGQFVGGSILPGYLLAKDSLTHTTQKIGTVESFAPIVPATSTIQAVSGGVLFGIVGGVDLLIAKYQQAVGTTARLIITGGDAHLITEHSQHQFDYIPDLVLLGLSVIAASIQN